MLGTIDKFNHTPNSDTLRKTVDSVMKYLEGKETPRKTGTGKVRWERCMQFLAEAMPRDEFDKYCHKIKLREQPDKAQPKKGKVIGKTEKPVRQGP